MDALMTLVAERNQGVLATVSADGRPQLSSVTYDYDPARRLVRISSTGDRVKVRNLRRDARAVLHVASEDFTAWTAVEGTAVLSTVASAPGDAIVAELIEVYRAIEGEHPAWSDYRAAMVANQRLVIRFRVEHAYGRAR
jgi:PPOX class probable F420-dependent enzyme